MGRRRNQFGIGLRRVGFSEQQPVLQGEGGFDQARDSSSFVEMPRVSLTEPMAQKCLSSVPIRMLCQRADLRSIAQRRGRAVRSKM